MIAESNWTNPGECSAGLKDSRVSRTDLSGKRRAAAYTKDFLERTSPRGTGSCDLPVSRATLPNVPKNFTRSSTAMAARFASLMICPKHCREKAGQKQKPGRLLQMR